MRAKLLLAVLFVFSVTLSAQTFRGSITGTVTDSTGAAVSGAKVTAANPATGASRSVTTDDSGNYNFPELQLGTYNIEVEHQGFRKEIVRGVQVIVGSPTQANATLTTGEVRETVDVSAEVPVIETQSDTTGDTISGEQAKDLPVNGRDFTKLLVLVPGAAGDPSGAADSPGSFGLFSINGNRGRSNNYLLDGTDMNDGYRNLPAINEGGVFGTPATILPVDAIAEVPVVANSEPEYGRNSGAIVNLVTRSGTNNVHGSVYEYFRNDALDARNFFNSTGAQDPFHNNQFGGAIGGPIVKDHTFFFVSYEGQRETGGIPTPETVPTLDDINTYTSGGGVINPVIQKLLARNPWGPLPQFNGDVVLTNPFNNTIDSVIAKIDQHFGGDLLTGRYYFGNSTQSYPLALVGGGVTPGFNTYAPTRVQIVSLSYTHIVSPKLLVEARGGWNRFAEQFLAQDQSFDPASIGLDSAAPGTSARDGGLPLITIAGYGSIGANASDPRGRVDTNTQFFSNASYNTGKHNYKWGYEFRRTSVAQFFDASYRGKLEFGSLDDFLAGNPTDGGRSAEGNSDRHTYQDNNAVYFQDNWRLTPKFTFNYGLRWDYYGVIGEKNNLFSILDSSGNLVYVGQPGGPSSLYPKDWNNFGPRLSFAYDPLGHGKTVIRAGWGLFYDAFSQDFFAGQLPYNTFNPGPAFNNVAFNYSPNPIVSGQPVFSQSGYAASDVFTVAQNLRTPYIQNFNLNVEQQLSNGVALEVGYVGSQGRKLARFIDLNQDNPPGSGTFAYPNRGYVNQFQSSAASNYNGLQVSLKVRQYHGFESTANFTWSHSIDNASDGQDYVPNASQPDNSFNPAAERANSNFDIRRSFKWYWSYDLPKFNVLPWLTNGWNLNGVITLDDGQPFNVNYLFEGDYNGSGEYFGRPDLVGNPWAGTSTPFQYLNLSAFAVPCTVDGSGNCLPGTQHFGDLPRNAFVGPAFKNFDFSFGRTFHIHEAISLRAQADFFNVFNHPNFTNPLLPNFGLDFLANGISPTGTGVGYLPLTATPDVGIGNPFLGGGGPRDIQLSLKLNF